MGQIDRLSENIQVAARIMRSHAVFRSHAVPEPLRFADQLPGPFQLRDIGAGIAAGAADRLMRPGDGLPGGMKQLPGLVLGRFDLGEQPVLALGVAGPAG